MNKITSIGITRVIGTVGLEHNKNHTIRCHVSNIGDMMAIIKGYGFNDYDLEVEHDKYGDYIRAKHETVDTEHFTGEYDILSIIVWFI